MSQARSPLRHLEGALGWAIVGMLLTYGLVNLIGFISPFWAAWRHEAYYTESLTLLHAWQPITPWFSLCFLVAGWHLALAMRSMLARVAVFAVYALVPVAMIGSRFAQRAVQQADTPVPPQLPAVFSMVAGLYLALALMAFLALAWWTLRRTNRPIVAEEGAAR